jgi:hypothetical protein
MPIIQYFARKLPKNTVRLVGEELIRFIDIAKLQGKKGRSEASSRAARTAPAHMSWSSCQI